MTHSTATTATTATSATSVSGNHLEVSALTSSARRASAQELQAAYRALLDAFAVLAVEEPAIYRTIRMRQKEMQTWLYDATGWWLTVTSDCAYVAKLPATALPWQGFDTGRDRPLGSPLDYELLVWALWYGERKPLDHTFLIGMLASEIAEETRPYVGAGHIDWNVREHRESLVRAMRALEDMGAVRRLDGEAEWFERDGVEADLVYEFTPVARVLRVQPARDLLPPGIDLATAGAERALSTRQRLYRLLLTTPAVLAELEPQAFALLTHERERLDIAADLEARFGWFLEVTPTYAALLRQREPGAQPSFPTGHILSRIVLLVCQHFRTHVARRGATEIGGLRPDGYDRLLMDEARFQSELGKVKQKYDRWWGATTRAQPLPALRDDVLAWMRGWGLASGPADDGQITIYPTAARFGAIYADGDTGLTDEGDEE